MGIQITIDGDKESQEFRRKLDYLLKLPKENEVVEFKKTTKIPTKLGSISPHYLIQQHYITSHSVIFVGE